MAWLKTALERGFDDFGLLQQDADLDSLRGLPEFASMLPKASSA